MNTDIHFLSYLAQLLLEGEMFQTKAVDKVKAYFYVKLRFLENCTVYEIMWKILYSWTGHMTLWCLRILSRTTKAKNMHSE
jgi:hypothetical protein